MLVIMVVLIGVLFALPNVFSLDLALQVERKNRAPMDDFARQSIEDLLRKQQVPIKRDYIDDGRLVVAFGDVAAQLGRAIPSSRRCRMFTARRCPMRREHRPGCAKWG